MYSDDEAGLYVAVIVVRVQLAECETAAEARLNLESTHNWEAWDLLKVRSLGIEPVRAADE